MKEQAVRQAKDLLITVLILTAATGIGNIFWYFSFTKNIISVYILGTLLTSLFTKSYFYGFLSSFSSVLLFNFCFTEPRLTLHAYERGYPVTFAIMLIVSIITVTLAIQNIRNAEEKERAAVRAKNEQLRADLLRTISHDLRTPLTSISGNASNLISNYEKMDDPTRKQTFLDIYDDSMWLINLVENILSISRIEDGRMNLSISTELVSEVFEEALRHTNRHSGQHTITVQMDDDLLLAHMDAKLVVQVLINLVDNAIKYTPAGSHIVLSAAAQGESAVIRVSDDGPGIPDEAKEKVFEMFSTGEKRISDSRRSLGLGLALCRTIIAAYAAAKAYFVRRDPHGALAWLGRTVGAGVSALGGVTAALALWFAQEWLCFGSAADAWQNMTRGAVRPTRRPAAQSCAG